MQLLGFTLAQVAASVRHSSAKARAKRAVLLRSAMSPREDWAVLDLGSSDGRHSHSVLPECSSVCLADVDLEAGSVGAAAYGCAFVPLRDDGCSRSRTGSSTWCSAHRCSSMSQGRRVRSRGTAMLARLRTRLLAIRPDSPARSAASAGATSSRLPTGASPSTHTPGCPLLWRSCRNRCFCGS
jgi:hypothetical protein